jgi:hypothetical protein
MIDEEQSINTSTVQNQKYIDPECYNDDLEEVIKIIKIKIII